MIEIKNLSASYDTKDIIKDLSLTIDKSEKLCIIGPNGSGKTTLLRVLSGVLPYRGSVKIDGKELKEYKGKSIARKIGMLSQLSAMYFSYSIFDTVLMGRYAYSKGITASFSREDKDLALKAIEAVGLKGMERKTTDKLSGGQLQRVFLAKLICQDPEIILLDEPTNHLDLSYQKELMDFLTKWAKEKDKTLIGVLHDMNLSAKFSNRLVLIDEGQIVLSGDVKEVFSSERIKDTFKMDIISYMKDNLDFWSSVK